MSNAYARGMIYRRLADGTFVQRGDWFDVVSASGGWYVNRIGYGKLKAAADVLFTNGVENDDFAVVWDTADYWPTPRRVAQFIVQSRQYSHGAIELSGPNYLGALADYVSFDRIGDGVPVLTLTEGFRPHPDNDILPLAAYAPRYYRSGGGAPTTAGKTRFNTDGPVIARVGDTLIVDFSTPDLAYELFVTTITHVTDGNGALEFTDGLPYTLQPHTPIYIHSTMINVADASQFVVGERVKLVSNEIGYDPLIIGTIKNTEVIPNNSDYIELVNRIPISVPIGYYAISTSYVDPVLDDVERLLRDGTHGIWTVNRAPWGYIPTTYAPNGETVFEILTALAEKSGWQFRLSMDEAGLLPRNKIDYFPEGRAYPAGNTTALRTLGTGGHLLMGYGEILDLQTEDAATGATHLVPFGGGSGETRFTIADADIFEILDLYRDPAGAPLFAWGSDGINHYIFYRRAVFLGVVERWRVETFSHIYPENEASPLQRKRAANDLLHAACQWLLLNHNPEVTYTVTCHTVSDPRPGDSIWELAYTGVESFPIVTADLRISEVHHELAEASGIRQTRLVLNSHGARRQTGEEVVASAVRQLARVNATQTASHRGGALVTYEGAQWRGESTLSTATGGLNLETHAGDIAIGSSGDVNIDADQVNVTSSMNVVGVVQAGEGVTLPGDDGIHRNTRYQVVRGIPRLISEG